MAEKRKIYRVTDSQGTKEQIYPQTSADNVVYENTIDGTAVTDVKGALDKVATGIGVTGVKGNAESTYRKGQVNITPENIGAAKSSDITTHNNNAGAHPTLLTAVSGAMDRANDAYALAEGRARSISYETISAAVTDIGDVSSRGDFRVGDNVFIVDLDVPDLWVSGVSETHQSYLFNDVETFLNNIRTGNGQVRVGYYYLSILETQKVDLTNYQTKTDNTLPTTSKTVVGAINEVKSTADSAKTTANSASSAVNTLSATMDQNMLALTSGDTKVGKAGQADKLTTARTLSISGDASGSTTFDGSANKTITLTLKNSGVAAGTYSVLAVNAKGLVTGGNQLIEFGAAGQTQPSASLAIGGLFFELQS